MTFSLFLNVTYQITQSSNKSSSNGCLSCLTLSQLWFFAHSIPHGSLSWGSSAHINRGSWLHTLFWAARQIHRNEGSLDSYNAYLSHYIFCFLSFQGFLTDCAYSLNSPTIVIFYLLEMWSWLCRGVWRNSSDEVVVGFLSFAQIQAVTGGPGPQKQFRLLSGVSQGLPPCNK